MKKRIWPIVLLLLVILMPVSFAVDYPEPTTDFFVNDFANILSGETEKYIVETSAALANETGAQIVVVTIKSLDGRDLESYATGLFREWGIGDATKNNGVLLLIALDERRSRIEVGYGLEGALNDAKTGRIQDDYLIGPFQAEDYDTGVTGTYLRLAEEVYREYNIDPSALTAQYGKYPSSPVTEAEGEITIFHVFAGIIIFILVVLDLILNRGRLTRFALYALARGSKSGGGRGGFGGGGGRSGGGGSSRGW